jgi:hypothetical protein
MSLDRLVASTETALADLSSSRLSEPYLVSALRALQSAREAPDDEAAARRLAPLAHQISDSWPHDSMLGSEILAYVQSRRSS